MAPGVPYSSGRGRSRPSGLTGLGLILEQRVEGGGRADGRGEEVHGLGGEHAHPLHAAGRELVTVRVRVSVSVRVRVSQP